jgi:hypothetical protein
MRIDLVKVCCGFQLVLAILVVPIKKFYFFGVAGIADL